MVAMPRGLLQLRNDDVNSRGKRLRVIKLGCMEKSSRNIGSQGNECVLIT
jgi:hypothetical protein